MRNITSFRLAILLTLSLCGFPGSAAYGKYAVGITRGKLRDGTPYMTWYPSASALKEEAIAIGHQTISGLPGASWLKGRHRLILISPGSGGSFLSYWRTAHFLASHGYVVASLNHGYDNALDYSGSSSIAVFNGRPQEMSRLLDYFLKTDLLRYVNISQISAMGFSAGAYTVLVMEGAIPSTKSLHAYCRVQPQPNVMCFRPRGFARITSLFSQYQGLSPHPDPRIRSVVAVAPPGDALFSRSSFRSIHIPVLLIAGGEDRVLIYPNNALYIKESMGDAARLNIIKQAGHLSYLSLSVRPRFLPPLLRREKNIASKTVRTELHNNILDFLIHGD